MAERHEDEVLAEIARIEGTRSLPRIPTNPDAEWGDEGPAGEEAANA